jgi:hypothetical protein
MYKVLGKLRTQYWFWFIRDQLIELELKKRLDSKRLEKLNKLKENSTLNHIYTMTDLRYQLHKLSPYSSLDSEFDDSGSKYKNGSRVVPDHSVIFVEEILPGSQFAYKSGPKGLFSIIEAQSLSLTVKLIAIQFLELFNSKVEELISDNEDLKLYTIRLKNCIYCNITVDLIDLLDEIIEYLFPRNQWREPLYVINRSNVEVVDFNDEDLFKPRYFELKELIPIIISHAFFRAKYFDEINYLSKICYDEGYLILLNKMFLIDKDFWLFLPDSIFSVEVQKDSSIKVEMEGDLSDFTEGEAGIKNIFNRAYEVAHQY